jgi:methylated-DNA-[protein]-cysteine S-methyltransferase
MIEPKPLHYRRLATPIGHVLVAGDRSAVTTVNFERESEPHPSWSEARSGPVPEAARQLEEYFAGARRTFDLPLAPRGTPFQQRVWEELRGIPYGQTTSYGELARRIGQPTASRAVGAANGANPIPIIIPCHRAVGSDGSLTGYGGGVERKQRLLAMEAGQSRLVAALD